MSIFNNNKLDPFGTNSLFADIKKTNQQINSMDLPSSTEEEEKKRKKAVQIMKLRNLADTLNMVNAQKSGNAQAAAMYSNRRRQRQLDEENARAKAEQKEKKEAFIKAYPQYAKMIEMNELFGFNPPAAKDRRIVLQNGIQYYADTGLPVLPNAPEKTPPKLTKSDYVVDILGKMKSNPGYVLTPTDQRILDTIADTDPMKIMVRNRLNEMQTSKFSNENNNQSGLVTVTTQEQYDALPSGTLFIEDGKQYRKP